jgi:hypothetical protein
MRLCTGKNDDYLGNTPSLNLQRYSISEFCNILAMSMTIFVGNDLIETKIKSVLSCAHYLEKENTGICLVCI